MDYLGFPGARDRFAVNYGLSSTKHNTRLWLKVFLNPTRPTGPNTALRDEDILEKGDPGLKVESVTGIWPGAEWMGGAYDMSDHLQNHPAPVLMGGLGAIRNDDSRAGLGESETTRSSRANSDETRVHGGTVRRAAFAPVGGVAHAL